MLFAYMQKAQQLFQDVKQDLITPVFLITFINEARRQIAGEGECVRALGTIPTVVAQRNYNFASLTLSAGIGGVLNARSMLYDLAGGQQWVTPRNWEWFQLYAMNTPVPASGAPTTWSQFGQGSTGSFYVDPIPDLVYALTIDCVTYPSDLVDDTTVETIPALWTDAVSYFAAYLCYLYVQNHDRAMGMMQLYSTFMERARKAANPSVNRYLYQQSTDATMIAKLGLTTKANQ